MSPTAGSVPNNEAIFRWRIDEPLLESSLMELSLYARTAGLLERHQFRPQKSLSQHFLIDEEAFQHLLSAINPQKSDTILEIGSGLGFFTEALANVGAKVIAVEIDNNLCKVLQEHFKEQSNVTILCQNVLKVNLNQLGHRGQLKAVGNLPYHISGMLLRWFLEYRSFFSEMILMVQKEVAERLVSKPGTKSYGVLSLVCQYFTMPSILFLVSSKAFIPSPKVDSAVVKLIPTRDETQCNPWFEKLVKRSFSQRRKTLFNNLRSWNLLTQTQWKTLLQESGLKEKARAEEIPLEIYIDLAEQIRAYISIG